MRDPLEDRPTADPTDEDGGTPHDPERAEQAAIERRKRLERDSMFHEPDEPPPPEQVRSRGVIWVVVGALVALFGAALLGVSGRALALVFGGTVGVVEGARRIVSGRRSVDLPPELGCAALLAAFGAATIVCWLLIETVLR
jgi:hypothetical protein